MNVRSLAPKIYSLIEHFNDLDLAFTIVSETWFIDGPVYTDAVNELDFGHNIKSICVNRKEKRGRNTGGGIAILFKPNKINLVPFPIRRSGCEIVAAKGKIPQVHHPFYIIGLYIPPNITKK